MDPETYEIEETITIPMACHEYESAKTDLRITVRITWTPSDGIFAEPLAYQYAGRRLVNVGSSLTAGVMDDFVKACVDENYDQSTLDVILSDDPAFERAMMHQAAEATADLGWLNSRRI